MDTKLINYKQKLDENWRKIQAAANPYCDELPQVRMELDSIKTLYQTKLNDFKPQIMVYGIYNAGKSSIINELLKADKAKVADKPTTDHVDYYEWNGYEIADTPGVGAPIEHERVTVQQLKKADIVLFVMSTTGSNEKAENYSRMKDISDSGKKIIIILNDKNGDLGRNDDVIQKIKVQVAANMKNVDIANVDEKYYIIIVNAARAKKGRLENKPALINLSGFDELERVILSELRNTDSFMIIGNTITEAENSLNKIIDALSSMDKSAHGKQINEILQKLKDYKVSIRRDMDAYIKNQADIIGKSLPGFIWNNRNSSKAITQQCIQEQIQKLSDKIQSKLEAALRDMQDDLSIDIKNLVKILQKIKVQNRYGQDVNLEVPDNKANVPDTKEKDDKVEKEVGLSLDFSKISFTDISQMLTAAKEMLSNKSVSAGSDAIGSAAKSIATGALAKEAATLLAGKVGGKMLASFVPYVGPIVMAGQFLYSLLSNDNEAERRSLEAKAEARNQIAHQRIAAESQARQELQQKCIYMMDEVADELCSNVNNILDKYITQMEDSFNQQNEACQNEKQKMAFAIAELRSAANEFSLIKTQLKN